MADESDGLIFACIFDGQGGAREVGWQDIEKWTPEEGLLWSHLDWTVERARQWLSANLAEPAAADALLADDTRPRSVPYREGLFVILRGVNLNPESDPEDMVSARMWIDSDRVITTRRRPIKAIDDIRENLTKRRGPKNAGDFLVSIADRLVERMGPTLDNLGDEIDDLETEVLEPDPSGPGLQSSSRTARQRLLKVRRQAISLRRHLGPQRDAMTRLQAGTAEWQTSQHNILLREIADHITRYVEDLDAIRDRGAVIQDELRNRLSEDMNKTMYVLTVVASVLLPLSFVTGLLGINVDGIPGAKEAPSAFYIVITLLALIAIGQAWLFRRLKWI
jgi:zinc transporter